MKATVLAILKEIKKPENDDLKQAIQATEQSKVTRGTLGLQLREKLDSSQIGRWDAIIEPHDDGWSGGIVSTVILGLQHYLSKDIEQV